MQKMFTVEHDERMDRYEVVRWNQTVNGARTGTAIEKFYVAQDAQDVCEWYNDTQLPDIGCEFDGRYDEQFEVDNT
jgi:hypothetical protein